jgi:hypothetical protein
MRFLDIAKVTERGQEKWNSGFPSGRATMENMQ